MIQAEIERTATERLSLWTGEPMRDEDVARVARLTDRLAELHEEKRLSLADDQVQARRQANRDPLNDGHTRIPEDVPELHRPLRLYRANQLVGPDGLTLSERLRLAPATAGSESGA